MHKTLAICRLLVSVDCGVSSPTRACFGGGGSPSLINTIDFIAIPTTGNASDFGDLTRSNRGMTSCSNGHGGL